MRTIGGPLDTSALAALSGDAARLRHFRILSREQQAEAIRRQAVCGHGEHTIARATGLSVEQIRHILGEQAAA